jgi:lysozyme family protein
MMVQRSFSQEKNFKQAFDILMKWEGGYSNHPKDPGGETLYGVTRKYYPETYNLIWDRLQNSEDPYPILEEFYYNEYWYPYARFFDDYKYDYILFELMEISMNTGKFLAVKIIKIACNIFNQGIDVNSKFDAETALACMKAYDKYGMSFINCINAMQGMHYFTLALTKDNMITFLRGWMKRLTLPDFTS